MFASIAGQLRRHSLVVSIVAVLSFILAALAILVPITSHNVEGQAAGTVTVTATNNAKITISISDATAAYGVNVAPDGTGTGGEITSVTSTTGTEGAYYIWTPSITPLVRVKSNKTWNGTIAAAENSGSSSSMTISSGALRYSTSVPGTYSAASSELAFTTAAADWQTNHAKGNSTYTFYYLLRVDWTDDPGTFSSTVTYSVSQ